MGQASDTETRGGANMRGLMRAIHQRGDSQAQGKSTARKGIEMNLRRRVERIEGEMKPMQLRAVIQGFLADSAPPGKRFVPFALAPNDPRLQQGMDKEGEAVISRWWSVIFFRGNHGAARSEARATQSGHKISKTVGR